MVDSPQKGFLSGLGQLVEGVVNDVQKLVRETGDLVREIATSSHKTGRIGSALIGGVATVLVGALLLCQMLVHMLAWYSPGMPMWAAYAVIGFPVLGVGIGLMAWARRSRIEALDPLQEQSAKVMRDVTETVEHVGQQVEAARESLHETAESIRDTLDVNEQMDRHPWAMLAGALSVGLLGGALLRKSGAEVPERKTGSLEHLAQKLEPEIVQLKKLALGTLFGIVRDLATKSAPEPLEQDLEEVMDGFTTKFGGTPIQGPILRESANGHSHRQQRQRML